MKTPMFMFMTLMVTTLAYADGAAPAKTESDIKNNNVEIHISSDYGKIKLQNNEAGVSYGYSKANGKNAESFSGNYSAPVFINGKKNSSSEMVGVSVDPNLSIQGLYDPETRQFITLDATAGKLTLPKFSTFASAGRRLDNKDECEKQGGTIVDAQYNDEGYQVGGHCEGVKFSNATVSVGWGTIVGGYHMNAPLGAKTMGAEIGVPGLFFPGSSNGHVAFQIAGANIDLCYDVEPVKLLLGDNQIKGAKSKMAWRFGNAKLCAGVSLGENVGHLYDQASVEYTMMAKPDGKDINPFYAKGSNEVGIDHVGGSPLGVSYTYTKGTSGDSSGNTSGYTEHNVALKGAF